MFLYVVAPTYPVTGGLEALFGLLLDRSLSEEWKSSARMLIVLTLQPIVQL